MSAEASTKPVVEEPTVATQETETPAPVAETTESKPTEVPAPTTEATEPTATEEVAPVKEAPKPIEEGTLGYKGPGLLKGLIFQKKHFWFGSEPVEHKNLTSYLRGEKPEAGNHNAAWAAHTGKGLLFFSKKSTEKLTPAHIFNLSEVTDINDQDSPTEFSFLQGGHKHTFQTSSHAERESWVATLKSKVDEAKTLGEGIKETEEYKTAHSSLTKPVVVASASAPKKSTEVKDKLEAAKEEKKEEVEAKKEEKAEKAEEKKEAKEEKKEEKKERTKSRSASRKRASIFGSIGFGGKKEEKVEKKEETPVAASETPAAASSSEPVPAPVETAPIVTEPSAAPGGSPTEEKAVAPEPKPTASKRNSIFDSFKSFGQKKPTEEKKTEETPAVPAKEAETKPVGDNAPVIPAVESQEPLSTSVVTPGTAPTEEPAAATNGESKAVETPAVKSDKRKSSLPWLSKKKEATTSDEEGEKKPTSPFAKLRATVKAKSSPKAEKAAEKEKTPEPEASTSEAPVKKEETPVVGTEEAKKDTPVAATPQVAATA